MKMVKSLILGSAAGLIAVSGAQAADLPVKAKAVEYVKICSLYGAGFYYIPGTDTCIKLGGYLRVETALGTNSVYTGNTSGLAGANNRLSNYFTTRSREDLNIDTRTATEYGVVRTYFDATFTWTSGGYAGSGTTAYDSAPAGTNGNGSVAGGSLGMYYAFIQFAGFTMGKAVSQFSAPWVNYPGNNYDGLVGGGGTVTGVNQFSYTAQFGNGVSGTLSAQEQTQYYQAGVNNLGTPGVFGYGTSDYGGTRAPDLVAMLRVDQAWGLFQASVAAHNNHVGYYTALGEPSGHPADKWGWAGQLALSIKNIPTGAGDTINIQGVYTNGATRYNIQDLAGAAGASTVYGGTGLAGAYQSLGIGFAPDSVFAVGGDQQLVTTWGMRGAYTHNWDPYWNSAIYGAYAAVSYNDTAKTLMCGVAGVGGTVRTALGAGLTSCNPDYNIAQLGLITRWTPVKGLTFSADFTYTNIDQKYAGTTGAGASAAVAKPVAVYELKDQNTYQMLLRAQRNW
ncbi:porin [Bradyrhizobium sediminis]|uniref:Porin n=1 Tax=Bradyrhizobium sediminis TaxID=2840469 RepID=A0A975NLZ5_9BRAD|nr:porin [Bradyrhizobium sediminis]QWG16459.1 porin [Bradyrhizobium sediminis]